MIVANLQQVEKMTPEREISQLKIKINTRKKQIKDNLYSQIISEKKSIRNFNELINDIYSQDVVLKNYEKELNNLQEVFLKSSLSIISNSKTSEK